MLTTLLSESPEIELFDGVRHRKMSPKRTHGRLQYLLSRTLDDGGGSFGEVVSEWRCKAGRVDGTQTVLVPDVAWVSDRRLSALSDADAETPPFSPDIAIEIRSPGDDLTFLAKKIARYLATGAVLVLDVDPDTRAVVAHTDTTVATFADGSIFASEAAPWFSFDVTRLFDAATRKRGGSGRR